MAGPVKQGCRCAARKRQGGRVYATYNRCLIDAVAGATDHALKIITLFVGGIDACRETCLMDKELCATGHDHTGAVRSQRDIISLGRGLGVCKCVRPRSVHQLRRRSSTNSAIKDQICNLAPGCFDDRVYITNRRCRRRSIKPEKAAVRR